MVLAYTIWHWPLPSVEDRSYAAHQERFHAAIAIHPAPGFRWSQSLRVARLPWANEGRPVFQDRFFVDGWAVFEDLEAHAISGERREPHDRMASGVGGAVAGMYGLRLGAPPEQPRWSYWFTKPAGMSYDELYAVLSPLADVDTALWGRRLVLGPTPEFCLESAASLTLPQILRPLAVQLDPAWPT